MKSVFTLSLIVFVCLSQAQTKTVPVKPAWSKSDTLIKWMTIQEAEAAQKVKPKKILVSVYTVWCRWCKLEDSLAFTNKEIASYINQNFYPVKFNAETNAPVTFNGVRYSFIRDESQYVNEFAKYLLNGKMSYPGCAFIDEQGKIISAKNGYMDAYYLEAVLNYYGTGSYKKFSYNEFEFEFEGKIED